MRASFAFVLVVAGCGSSSSSPEPDAASLRPGVEDSSEVYKGTPSASETAFWTAVRDADDAGRAAAVAQMQADVAADPSNGYSAFLIGASHFMPPRALLAALAANQPVPPPTGPDLTAVPSLTDGLAHLTDPFYLGFDGGLLASLQLAAHDPAGGPTMQAAFQNNPAATTFISVLFDLQVQDTAKAQSDMYALFEFCNRGPLARDGSDAAKYAAKMAAGALRHRECYSGFLAPHGTPGELLIMGDLHALNGEQAAATAYYNAIASAPDAATWPLAPLLARRIAGTQPANLGTTSLIATGCGTCHTSSL